MGRGKSSLTPEGEGETVNNRNIKTSHVENFQRFDKTAGDTR